MDYIHILNYFKSTSNLQLPTIIKIGNHQMSGIMQHKWVRTWAEQSFLARTWLRSGCYLVNLAASGADLKDLTA